ncbi:PREDICTED: PRUPE_6G193600, partial [Prunus dulcis]
YNKRGKGIGQAHSEMQSYIGVLARSRVPLVDKKWSQIPKDVKEQIWEAVDMAFVVGQGGKKSVLTSAAKKWKDFKSTLTRHYILPYTNDKEKLSHPPETYKFIEKAQWDAFVASRLSKDFESVHSQHAQIREKLEYNHRLSRKGYAGLEDQLEETMPGVEIDRSTLWKRARQDKHGNIPDPKVAEKAKLIDELQKQVSEGKVGVDGSKDVLTMALGPEHPGRLRGVGAGISPRQYFNLPKPQRVSFDDRLKESLRVLLQEETNKMEAKAKEEALRMEARTKQLVEAEREHFLSQLSQLIPNFDPGMLKQRISQSPKNPMSDKASCSGGEVIEVGDYSNMGAPSSLKSLCRYVETTLLPEDKLLQFTIDKEVFGGDRDTFLLHEDITQFAGMEEIGATVVAVYMRYLHDVLKQANMCSMVGFIDPATVSANSGTIAERSRLVAARLQKTDGEQIFMMPYNPGRHWILLIVRAKKETVYFLDPLPGHRVVDEEAKNIVNSAIKMYNTHIARAGRKNVIWKTLSGTPKQPSSVECGYYVMRFMRDIIMDPSLGFENKYAKGNQEASYPQEAIDEVRNEWAEFVFQIIKQGNY